MKIAVSGKGGVGKTLVAGVLACHFASKGVTTIAIDADPSPNLALTLGLPLKKAREITPISENRELIETKTDTGVSGVYRLSFSVDDVVRDFSVKTPCGVNLIVMGTVRSMGAGCTCPANAVIRALLRHLVVERDEAVIVDMEAGVEHLGRGTARHVDTMLIVADSSMKSLETAGHVHRLAAAAGMKHVFLVGNKIADQLQRDAIAQFAEKNDLDVLGIVPFDEHILKSDLKGITPIGNRGAPAIQAIERFTAKLLESHRTRMT